MAKEKPFTVYLAGKMSGLPNYGFDLFNAAAEVLRDNGVVVINPAETAGGEQGMPRDWYFRFDYAVIDTVDAVVVLPNWISSKGAKGEVIHATEIGLPVYQFDPENGLGNLVNVRGWSVEWALGPRYEPTKEGTPMVAGTSIRERVFNLMSDGRWRSLEDIQAKTGGTLPSVSARLRDLRKDEFGGHTVERRRKTDSIYVYRLIPNEDS